MQSYTAKEVSRGADALLAALWELDVVAEPCLFDVSMPLSEK
jgi:hypothetical protein